jgi:type IV fimbrial biogenesis protein FimT
MTASHSQRAAVNRSRLDRRARGFTLIETIASVAVIAILVAAGLPSFKSTLANSRASVVGNRLLADLSRARSEAVMTRLPGVVCPSSDGATCSDNMDWSHGWIVYVERNQNNNQRSGSEPVLSMVSAADLGGLRVISSKDRTKARFLPNGGSGGTNLSLHVCDGSKLVREVVINMGGRARVENPGTSSAVCE